MKVAFILYSNITPAVSLVLVDRRTGVLVAFAEVQVQCILPLFGCVMTYVDTHIHTRGHAGSARLRLLFAAH